jgi:small neutral amino acid transporter SnatA (MarC family)
MNNISLFLKEVLSLLAIVEPLGAIPIFLSLTSGMS